MIKATTTRYVLKLHEQETMTSSGIIVKGSGDTQLAVIVDIGPEIEKPIPAGAKVVVDWQSCLPVKYKTEQFFIVDCKAVLGIVQE
jgi:co-chaperonin GroES (HSP10)